MTERDATCVATLQRRRDETSNLVEEVASIADEKGCTKDWVAHIMSVVTNTAGTLTAGTQTIDQMKAVVKKRSGVEHPNQQAATR